MSTRKKRAGQASKKEPEGAAPRKRPGPPRSAERRRQLLAAAHRAILRDGPGVSIEQIAAEAGVSRIVVYRHFGSRNGLAHAIVDDTFGGLIAAPRGGGRSGRGVRDTFRMSVGECTEPEDFRRLLHTWLYGFLAFVDWNPKLFLFLQDEGVLGRLWDGGSGEGAGDGFEDFVAASLRGVLEARGLDTASVQTWTDALVGIVVGVARRRVEDRSLSAAEVQSQIVALIWTGLERLLSATPRRRPPSRRVPRPAAKKPRSSSRSSRSS